MTLLRLHTFYGLTPYEQGGISGGLYDGENNIIADMYAGDAYEGKFANSVVINGVLYYNTQGAGTYAHCWHTWNPSNRSPHR